MNDELGIEAIQPSTVFISGKAFTETDAFNAVDDALFDLAQTGDLSNIDTAIDTLLGLQRLSGKSLARLLYGTKLWWLESGRQGNFDDHMESRHELKKVTIDRYITVWESIVSGVIPPALAERPMRDLVPIAKAISQGYELTPAHIKKLIKAVSGTEIGSILRIVKNKTPRKSSMQIEWTRKGDLVMWKDNKRTFLGWLDKEAYASNPDAQKAINRILDGAGITKK